MKEISFQPGKFQPIVEISQRDSGVPDSTDTNFEGLEEVAVATLQVSLASSRGYGSVISDPTPVIVWLASSAPSLLCETLSNNFCSSASTHVSLPRFETLKCHHLNLSSAHTTTTDISNSMERCLCLAI